jgi:HlyD family secretion protein
VIPGASADSASAGAAGESPVDPTSVIQAPGSLAGDEDPEALAAIRALEERRQRNKRARTAKVLIACAVAAAIFVVAFMSCALPKPDATGTALPETAAVTRGTLSSTVQATGTIQPATHVAVSPETSGIIQEVRVSEGQHVEAGDVMFVLKNTELERSLAAAEATVSKARGAVSSAQDGVNKAQDAYDKAVRDYNAAVAAHDEAVVQARAAADQAYRRAYDAAVATIPSTASEAERAALTEEAKETAQAAYDLAFGAADANDPGTFDHETYTDAISAAQSSVDSANEALEDAQREYDYTKTEADKRTIKAPTSGTVLSLNAESGASVGGASGGTSTTSGPLAQIADLSSLCVDVEVNEMDISSIKVGQSAKATFSAFAGLELDAKITSVASVSTGSASSASGDTSSGHSGVVTFRVETVIDKPDARLKPGMSASLKILTKDVPNVLIVPLSAIVEEDGATYVDVAKDESATNTERRAVVVSDRTSTEAAIQSGLEEGEVVLVSSGDDSAGTAATGSATTGPAV